jgi:hypothetical protein
MKKGEKISLIVILSLIVVFGLIQLIPVNLSNPPVESDIQAPPEVKAILKTSCYDCHSHETVWPWYSKFAPVSWLLASDANEGRSKLDFSTWNQYRPEKQISLIDDALKEIKEGGMPPWYYTIKHTGAKLSPEKIKLIDAWAQDYMKSVEKKEGKAQ